MKRKYVIFCYLVSDGQVYLLPRDEGTFDDRKDAVEKIAGMIESDTLFEIKEMYERVGYTD